MCLLEHHPSLRTPLTWVPTHTPLRAAYCLPLYSTTQLLGPPQQGHRSHLVYPGPEALLVGSELDRAGIYHFLAVQLT